MGVGEMKTIRVLVANRPRLLRELVLATISEQPDIEIVGEVQDEGEIRHAAEQFQPDFLIVALGGSDRLPDICYSVIENHPQIKIIAIAPDRESTLFYWASLNIHSNRLETSEEGVLNALRGKAEMVKE
jgi:DNA-binding NarL/FixJ family response regulator